MKTHKQLLNLALSLFLLFASKSYAQNYSYKGMYVYTLDSILNDASGKTQDVLLRYCRDSSINALTLSVGALNLHTNPSYVTKLASFMKKAKSRYGIKYFSAVFSDYTTLNNEIRFYQNSRTDSLEKFSYYNYEFEYWNNNFYTATGTGETDYCTKYLQPEGFSCDSVGAWNYFKKYIKKVDSLAQADNILSSLYIGVKSKDTLKNRFIANTVDLIMIACYKSSPTDLYQTNTTGKLTAFSKANHKVNVIPIFSSLSQSASENLKIWLKVPPTGKHAESSAMPYFMSEYNDPANLSTVVRSKLNIIGYQWFKYGGMPKDSTFTAITLTPIGLGATPSNTGATLTWSTISNATQYTVWYSPATSFNWTKTTVNSASVAINGLTSDSPYQFLVYAKTNNGTTASSLVYHFTTTSTQTTNCAQATGLSTTAIGATTCTLNWNTVNGATSYTVRYKATTVNTWLTLAVTTNSIALNNLTANTAYEFQVQTNCTSGNISDYTASTLFNTTALPCLAPENIGSSSITSTTATISWTAVTGASSYALEYKTLTGTTWQTLNTTALNKLISSLSAATTYNYRLQSVCNTTLSAYSSNYQFTTSTAVSTCAVPTGLAANSVSSTSALISWTDAGGGTTYKIQYHKLGSSVWTSKTVNGLSYTLSSLKSSTNYEVKIQRICSTNLSSSYSSLLSFKTLSSAAKVAAKTTALRSNQGITLQWNVNDEVSNGYYLLEKSEDGIEFEPFRKILAEADHFNGSIYEIIDDSYVYEVQQNSVWYKLSLVDENGNQLVLDILEVKTRNEFENIFNIFPNPNSGEQINLTLQLQQKEELLVVLIDMLGNQVYSKVIITNDNGSVATAINPSQELAKGCYQVIGYSSTKILSQKLIIQ